MGDSAITKLDILYFTGHAAHVTAAVRTFDATYQAHTAGEDHETTLPIAPVDRTLCRQLLRIIVEKALVVAEDANQSDSAGIRKGELQKLITTTRRFAHTLTALRETYDAQVAPINIQETFDLSPEDAQFYKEWLPVILAGSEAVSSVPRPSSLPPPPKAKPKVVRGTNREGSKKLE